MVNNIQVLQKNITDQVLERINTLKENDSFVMYKDYAMANELKMAWFAILEVKDSAKKPAIEVCSHESIANALFKMCIQGLAISKKQCAFIVSGNRLKCDIEYHGTIALAKRFGGVKGTPVGNCVYEGDTFTYDIDPMTGKKRILEHKQSLENIDIEKIRGAYGVLNIGEDTPYIEVMSIAQIRQSWLQGNARGVSSAHKNFTDQMAIKTVLSRACKLRISTSDDAPLFDTDPIQQEPEIPEAQTQPEAPEEPEGGKQKIDLSALQTEQEDPEAPEAPKDEVPF